MRPRNLLVIDDEAAFCGFVKAALSLEGYRVVAETDARRTLGLLRQGDFDVVLLDLLMPDLSGLELLQQIREHYSVLPVVVVTGLGGSDSTLEAMRRGATDFMTKPVDGALLDLRIRSAYDLERTRRRANTDGLTGLYNHRYLQERLQGELERAERYGRHLSLVMADLDRFKVYNDTYGHPRGDEVLIEVAETLRQVSRSCDVVARYGGEEFTLILPETPASEAQVLAERTRECIEGLDLTVGEVRVTMSLGIASFKAGDTKEDLIRTADSALYRAKHEGRNRVCVSEEAVEPVRVAPWARAFAV